MIKEDAVNVENQSFNKRKRKRGYSVVNRAVRSGGRNTPTELTARQSIPLPVSDAERNLLPTVIRIGSIAPIAAISHIGLVEVQPMNEEQFQAEKLYHISISIAKAMLEKGIIDREVYAIIDTKLLEKYRPISAVLLSGKPLT